MTSTDLPDGDAGGPQVADVDGPDDVPAVLARHRIDGERPVLVSVGGAGGMSDEHLEALRGLLADHLLPVLARHEAVVVDGGTRSGVMRVMGESVTAGQFAVPLVGVAARGTVSVPGRAPARDDVADLDPDHTLVLLVPGTEWGDESAWIADVATAVSGTAPSLTLVVNGGQITYADVERSIDAGRPIVVVAGTGRTADALAEALRGNASDPRAAAAAGSGLVQVVQIGDGVGAARLLDRLLTGD